jgi:hypothetical protein
MASDSDQVLVADPSGLTDADWAEINKLETAYNTGGQPDLRAALNELRKDVSSCFRVMGAIFPDEMRFWTKWRKWELLRQKLAR